MSLVASPVLARTPMETRQASNLIGVKRVTGENRFPNCPDPLRFSFAIEDVGSAFLAAVTGLALVLHK